MISHDEGKPWSLTHITNSQETTKIAKFELLIFQQQNKWEFLGKNE